MNGIPLLISNGSGIDLVDYFLNSFQVFDIMNSQNKVDKTLVLEIINELQTCTGRVVVNDSTTYVKSEQRNYSLSIVSDQTFINNLLYFINLYRASIPKITIDYQGTTYVCASTITINSSRFYILEFPPAPTPSE
jgi:hypothetical protein